ncbi:DUF481 domain-containing protein [Shewanella sp. 3B26]|uniref:DUF481 domain-containing protein n=1 Tax=Shewanella zhuhaiensis TaxID=2919576 RepID=A0AAJ1EZL6_9GAMM|nr:DUF481 domain-containing protein [Shewanella zhuhaiensis]MCH4296239.1 DUF481 domain-containing protein [Shewanella zhuhaiensis]
MLNAKTRKPHFKALTRAITFAALGGIATALSPLALATSPQVPNPFQITVDDSFDWLLLTSNELLKGELKNLYDDKLEFESDNLDTLYFDWEDVKALRSSGIVSVGMVDLSTQTGKLEIIDGKAYLDGRPFDRSQILTIIAGTQTEANYWSGKMSLGANLRSGNTDQIDYSATANIKRRTTESRLNSDYIGKYSKNDGENTVNNHRITGSFDWFISKQFYLRPVFIEYYKDPFLNIDTKLTLDAGLGYDIIDNSKTEWTIGGGPAYTYTRFSEVETGGSDTEGTAAFVLDTRFEHELTDDIDLNARYQLLYGNQDSGGYSHHALTGISIDLTDMFDLDVSLVWDRTNNPRANADGSIPKSDDYQLIIGIGIDL